MSISTMPLTASGPQGHMGVDGSGNVWVALQYQASGQFAARITSDNTTTVFIGPQDGVARSGVDVVYAFDYVWVVLVLSGAYSPECQLAKIDPVSMSIVGYYSLLDGTTAIAAVGDWLFTIAGSSAFIVNPSDGIGSALGPYEHATGSAAFVDVCAGSDRNAYATDANADAGVWQIQIPSGTGRFVSISGAVVRWISGGSTIWVADASTADEDATVSWIWAIDIGTLVATKVLTYAGDVAQMLTPGFSGDEVVMVGYDVLTRLDVSGILYQNFPSKKPGFKMAITVQLPTSSTPGIIWALDLTYNLIYVFTFPLSRRHIYVGAVYIEVTIPV